MLYMICYDIVSNRRRRKLSELLLDFGTRVQKSAFECDIPTEARLRGLVSQARKYIDPKTDTLRVYRICAACRDELETVGINRSNPLPKTIII